MSDCFCWNSGGNPATWVFLGHVQEGVASEKWSQWSYFRAVDGRIDDKRSLWWFFVVTENGLWPSSTPTPLRFAVVCYIFPSVFLDRRNARIVVKIYMYINSNNSSPNLWAPFHWVNTIICDFTLIFTFWSFSELVLEETVKQRWWERSLVATCVEATTILGAHCKTFQVFHN